MIAVLHKKPILEEESEKSQYSEVGTLPGSDYDTEWSKKWKALFISFGIASGYSFIGYFFPGKKYFEETNFKFFKTCQYFLGLEFHG